MVKSGATDRSELIRGLSNVGARPKRHKSAGRHSWTEAEISQFEAAHPIGTRARLAFALLLHTAQRRGDVIHLEWQQLRDGVLFLRQRKTGAELAIPVHPELAAILDAPVSDKMSKPRSPTLLLNKWGKAWNPTAFSDWFREQCDAAGLPKYCSAHGLRKAAARRLAEAGCSTHEIAAITGHASLREVERYTRAADQAKLARAAMDRIIKAAATEGRFVRIRRPRRRRRPDSSWPATAIRPRRFRRAQPLSPAARMGARRARRDGIPAYPSKPRPRGEAAAQRRRRAPAERAGRPAAR
jgi:Phage integrase family